MRRYAYSYVLISRGSYIKSAKYMRSTIVLIIVLEAQGGSIPHSHGFLGVPQATVLGGGVEFTRKLSLPFGISFRERAWYRRATSLGTHDAKPRCWLGGREEQRARLSKGTALSSRKAIPATHLRPITCPPSGARASRASGPPSVIPRATSAHRAAISE